jgi:DNA recombination protein RmuC
MIVTTVLLVLLAAGLVFAGLRLLRILRAELHALRSESSRQLGERNAEVDRRLEAMTATMDRRLETTTKTTSAIHQQLGQLGQANAEILARANDLKKLEQALRPPKARGGFGELLLGNLLRDRLPPDSYQLQYGFKTGERVDAVIRVERLVPVDAKFPLDNFERLADAETDEERSTRRRSRAI